MTMSAKQRRHLGSQALQEGGRLAAARKQGQQQAAATRIAFERFLQGRKLELPEKERESLEKTVMQSALDKQIVATSSSPTSRVTS
ncbi:MAG: hypothetical protein DWQ01_09835 [Planctomycetota bacterium]|nr:MAG: hypothetical protein DWQ01_09835 [Planctomycetota bacterium]